MHYDKIYLLVYTLIHIRVLLAMKGTNGVKVKSKLVIKVTFYQEVSMLHTWNEK